MDVTDGGDQSEQTAIDMLDHVIRTVAAESGMESDFIDDAISWLDDSQGWSAPHLEQLVEQLEVQAYARLEVNAEETLVNILERLIAGVDVSQVRERERDRRIAGRPCCTYLLHST